MLQARIAAGLRRALVNGVKLGRPLNDPCAIERARTALAALVWGQMPFCLLEQVG